MRSKSLSLLLVLLFAFQTSSPVLAEEECVAKEVSSEEIECILPETVNKQVCKVLEINQKSIETRKAEREALAELQALLVEGSELRRRLLDPENLQESEILNETLVNDLALTMEEKSDRTTYAVASTGALIVSAYAVRHMAKSAQGNSLLAKIGNHLNPFRGRGLKNVANSAFVLSIIGTFYNAYKIKETSDNANKLRELIDTLNQVQCQSQNLARMTSELEEIQTCFWFKAELFVEAGIASMEEDKFICHE